ncbi:humpty dumpty [Lycorma delicatula]|uniref:humpty dumpty n=1 Tax=Lycorma delicatula TaxID=130591 RepID=UPI003F50DBD5
MSNLLSPKREQCKTNQLDPKTPPQWKRPNEVMRLHKIRMKHKALQARMSKTQSPYNQASQLNASIDSAIGKESEKRKNPFRKSDVTEESSAIKRVKPFIDEDETNNSSVFKFLRYNESNSQEKSNNVKLMTFKNIFNKPSGSVDNVKEESDDKVKGSKDIPVDWRLRTRMRFMSLKPFAWNSKLKTCEEASGTTAFVRCLDTTSNNENYSLDTSANAQFHQCCLVWQHPVLPWVELYPRHVHKQNNAASTFAVQNIRDSMHTAWTESFRSAFQLVRAQQCPYFYILANTFTCLFRAAGVSGHSEIHALITPTTSGFRKILKDEDIEFTMPLKDDNSRRSFESQTDTGYNTIDSATDTLINTENTIEELLNNKNKKDSSNENKEKDDDDDDDDDDDEVEDDEEWLHSMGVHEDEIKRISSSQSEIEFGKEKKVDKTPESLVLVEGVEAQVLFNFLINCKSNIATTGPLTGIPPTIIAPVAFHGAILHPLKVRQSIVNVGSEQYHSMEIRGPILPHVVHSLSNILKQSSNTYSLTFASIESTSAFTLMHNKRYSSQKTDDKKETAESNQNSNIKNNVNSCNSSSITAFGQVNLSDCGLPPSLLKNFCKGDPEAVQSFDSLKYSDNLFTWL